jgi:hypothetical protein
MTVAFRDSLPPAEHLKPADAAVVELGRTLAAAIDATDDDKMLATLSGQFLAVCDRLGLHPKARRQLELDAPTEGRNLFDEARRVLVAAYGPDALESNAGMAD